MKQTGELRDAKSLHAEADIVSKVEVATRSVKSRSRRFMTSNGPSGLSFKTEFDGDQKGPDVVADGEKLTIHAKGRKEYTEEDTPSSLGDIGIRLLQLGPAMAGMLFANVLADDPADLLMQGVNSCSYVGKDKVDGTEVHRMKFSQDGFDWDLWVAVEGKPYIFRR